MILRHLCKVQERQSRRISLSDLCEIIEVLHIEDANGYPCGRSDRGRYYVKT